ncbi:MAG: tRNA pseudouridine(38-40) synthase TruA [Clostridia bacterium]|nr:tRNA pseudouridine(38-40) synthase TruA [Clostridia bacterium]
MRYAILLAYDGTDYGGWQIQKNSITVQEKLEEACEKVFGKKTTVTASGRTDSGVHAAGQVCHFDAETTIPAEKIADVLNRFLPPDIAVLASSVAPENFDANRSAKRKTYCYKFYLSERRNPLKDRYSVWVKNPLDIAKLRHISGSFVGKHDFKAYCKSGSQVKTTVREVFSVEVDVKESFLSKEIEISICGGGFLYNMVRTVAGTMINYAEGSLSEEEIIRSLRECDREAVGRTMPAKGLTLEKVEYGIPLFK